LFDIIKTVMNGVKEHPGFVSRYPDL
jgi:hypothetical protein